MKRMNIISLGALMLIALFAGTSCEKWCNRSYNYDRVMVVLQAGYFPGYNDLSYELKSNITSLKRGYVPKKNSKEALIVVNHYTNNSSQLTNPHILRIYKTDSEVVTDTVMTLKSGLVLTEAENLRKILNHIKSEFSSKSFGIVFSSHGFGWLPSGYYMNPNHYEKAASRVVDHLPAGATPYINPKPLPGEHKVKGFGIETGEVDGQRLNYELDIKDMANAIPMHLDYIIFDACFMGGVEVAYELKDVCDYIVFSPAEIPARGLNYSNMAHRLLESSKIDLVGLADDYYKESLKYSGWEKTATITVVDNSQISELASCCNTLFGKYRNEIAAVNSSLVQPYFRKDHKYFYDLEDILVQSGISVSDHNELKSALKACIPYAASTEYVLSELMIKNYSGLSMYLPCEGTDFLDNYYKSLAWNQSTGLVN